MHILSVSNCMCFVLNLNKKEVVDVRFFGKKYANSDFLCKFARSLCLKNVRKCAAPQHN